MSVHPLALLWSHSLHAYLRKTSQSTPQTRSVKANRTLFVECPNPSTPNAPVMVVGVETERMGSCDACDREVPLSQISTHMAGGAEGMFCRRCVRGGEDEEA